MILAAGRGERLRPLTDECPKALLRVGDKTLIETNLERLARAGIRRVVVNLDWLGEHIVEAIGEGRRYGLQVIYSPEYGEVLETGGGIVRALPLLGSSPFWVVNADVWSGYAPRAPVLADDILGHLVLVPTPSWRGRGDFDLEGRRVLRSERPALTFSGIALYRPELFADAPAGRHPLAPLLFAAAARGQLSGELYRGRWEDVGTPERLARVRRAP